MKNIPLLLGTLIGTVALVVGLAFFFSRTTIVDSAVLVAEARLVKGNPQAAITLVEFSDFQCPACRAVYPLIQQVATTYPDQVKIVFRHYPLTMHQYAMLAAQAAEAAHAQGKFWEMHDKLFANQDTWSELASEQAVLEEFTRYAEELNLDKAKFLETIQSDTVKQQIARDIADGDKARVRGTPSIYLNSQQVPASQIPQLLERIESLVK